MSDDLLGGILLAILLLLYLISVRIKGMQENLTCVHDFVHWMADGHEHPHDVVETAISRIKESDQETPSPFKDWDES